MSINRVILFGRLTADPDVRNTQGGQPMCRFTVAVDRPQYRDKPKAADYVSCQAWRGTADFVSKYFTKGKPIVVEGSMRNDRYTGSDGVERYASYVLVDSVSFTINDSTQRSVQPRPQSVPNADVGDLDDFEQVLGSGDFPAF